jgi:hypothetical protein
MAGDFDEAACCSAQQQDQDDEWNWNSNQPEQNGHAMFLSGERERMR